MKEQNGKTMHDSFKSSKNNIRRYETQNTETDKFKPT